MRRAKRRPTQKRLRCGARNDLGLELFDWVRRIVRSNHELASVLERLRFSYELLLAGMIITNAEEILCQVDEALQKDERSTVVMSNILGADRAENSHDFY